MSNLIKNSTIYAIGDIAPRLLSFISFPILTQYLTPAEYGIVNYVNTVNIFLVIIGFLCLNTYYLVYYYRMGNETEQKKLLGNISIFVVGINLFLSLLLFVVGPYLFTQIGSNVDFYPYMAIGLITNLFNIVGVLPCALFRLQERPLPLTVLNVLKGVSIFGLTLWLVVGYQFKAEGILLANMVVTIIFGIIFAYITVKNMIWHFDWGQIKKALIFSLPLVPGALSYNLVSMSDRILIDKYLNLSDLGIYSTASTLALILNIVSYGAYKAFEPYFFKIYGTLQFTEQFTKVRNVYFFVIISGALGLALFAKEFFQIFSAEKFHIAYYYVPMILIGVVASSMSMLYGTIITAREKTKISSAISICGGLASVCLNIILLPRLGIVAACITSAFTLCSMLLAYIYFSKVNISHIRVLLSFAIVIAVVCVCVYCLDFRVDVLKNIMWKMLVYFLSVFICMRIILSNNICYIRKYLRNEEYN
ncbi:MAG: oligosaccharide flippase family protein [Bacteroidaceae bacterium]|nr:oligosaccharide flippase family protein [Bacteroidaceae bacterium]